MKYFPLVLLMALCRFALADEGVVHHPAPKEPVYISSSLYDSFKESLPLPPTLGSITQKEDEKELLRFQRHRTAKECEVAKSEVLVSLQSFYGKSNGPLEEQTVVKLAPFFEQIRNDGDFFIQKMKKDFPRKRPFLYVKGVEPCVPKEVTDAYPSGHAVLSKLYALILGDMFPKDAKKFEVRSLEIAEHRVLSGMHHPSDIAAGRALAEKLYVELKKSKNFQRDFRTNSPVPN